MTADKRTTHTDALETLGTIIGENEKRDAIHLAVEPVIAGENLKPSDRIFLQDGKAFKVDGKVKALGIVDPFLTSKVLRGERFWLVVMPRQITSLRHVWKHPDFPTESPTAEKISTDAKSQALDWIRNYADELSSEDDDCYDDYGIVTADELIDTAMSNIESNGWGDYIVKGGLLEGVYVSDEFWNQLAILKDIEIPEEKRNNFFSCSC